MIRTAGACERPGPLSWASALSHRLRYAAGSRITSQQVDLRFVRDNFGYASIDTTSANLRSAEDARHEVTQSDIESDALIRRKAQPLESEWHFRTD
ncbi:hypothetical protein [Cupriavidus oxalaticus]|uniref:hypothetical protein n=1 Tax=Cupriavidus oxalaticus TaxID=96344 RepID=UPI00197AB641